MISMLKRKLRNLDIGSYMIGIGVVLLAVAIWHNPWIAPWIILTIVGVVWLFSPKTSVWLKARWNGFLKRQAGQSGIGDKRSSRQQRRDQKNGK